MIRYGKSICLVKTDKDMNKPDRKTLFVSLRVTRHKSDIEYRNSASVSGLAHNAGPKTKGFAIDKAQKSMDIDKKSRFRCTYFNKINT